MFGWVEASPKITNFIRAGNGHVHAVGDHQKTNLSIVIGAYQADENDIAFLSLKAVNGVNGDGRFERPQKTTAFLFHFASTAPVLCMAI